MKHGEERNQREETERYDVAHVTVTVSERWCDHCHAWIQVRGVSGATGAIAWMAHDGATPGVCPQAIDPGTIAAGAPAEALVGNAGTAEAGAPSLGVLLWQLLQAERRASRAEAALAKARLSCRQMKRRLSALEGAGG